VADEPGGSSQQREQQAAKARRSRRPLFVLAAVVVLAFAAVGMQAGWLPSLAGSDEAANGQPQANTSPRIATLAVASDRIEPGGAVQITCNAFDDDGDALAYTWSASDGAINGTGPEVTWTAPDAEGLYRVFVTVDDGRGGAAESSLTLRVRSNQPPEILVMHSEIAGDNEWLVPGASAHVSCEAIDPDGDAMSFEWSASSGKLFGQGNAVVWQAPPTLGMQWITVVVTDIYGASAERSIPVTINAVEPPPLNGLMVSALDTDLFRPYGDSWRIFKERACVIEARIDDQENSYTYDWRAERGDIVSDGPSAIWTAPASPKGWVNIVLVVSDSHGNKASDAIRIYVETCTSCM